VDGVDAEAGPLIRITGRARFGKVTIVRAGAGTNMLGQLFEGLWGSANR